MGLNEKFFKSAAGGITASDNFAPVLYTGNWNGSNTNTVEVGFRPDWIWIKRRDGADGHHLYDSVRGMGKPLYSNTTGAENASNHVNTTSTGFTLVTDNVNQNGNLFIAWCWKAGGAAVLNEDGTLDSQVSANVDAGFSIVSYTGGSANQNVGHGLDETPQLIIVKNRDTAGNGWATQSPFSGGADYHMMLNSTQEAKNNVNWIWNDTEPTSSVFSIGENGITNTSGNKYIGYCFHSVDFYQKVGSYTGGGSNLTVINVGFAPTMVLFKCTSNAGSTWRIFDTVRGTDKSITVNSSLAEYDDATNYVDFTSTGFEFNRSVTQANPDINGSGRTYIYLAIA